MQPARVLMTVSLLSVVSSPVTLEAQARIGGVELPIGMDKAEVLSRLADGFHVDSSGGTWMVLEDRKNRVEGLGYLRFMDDRLVTVSREWTPEDSESASAVIEATISALVNVSESTDTPCKLVPQNQAEPDARLARIEIQCGFRGVVLTAVQSDLGSGVSISEFWRAFAEQNY